MVTHVGSWQSLAKFVITVTRDLLSAGGVLLMLPFA